MKIYILASLIVLDGRMEVGRVLFCTFTDRIFFTSNVLLWFHVTFRGPTITYNRVGLVKLG